MKRTILIVAALFFAVSAFCADIDIFAPASDEVKTALKKTDDLISKGQYESAFNSITDENEYFIYKRTDIAINYFAQSVMHGIFSFVNLAEGEDLMEIRRNGNNGKSMSMTVYNVEEVIDSYVKSHGESPVLNLALAQFYSDVLLRYGAQWTKKPAELYELIVLNYDKAFAAGVYNKGSLWVISQACLRLRKYDKSIELINNSLKLDGENGADWYNLAVACMYSQKYGQAVEAAKNAVKYPEESVANQVDAYILLADAYYYNGDIENTHKTLSDGRRKYNDNPSLIRHQAKIYLRDLELDKAEKEFDCLFAKSSTDRTFDAIINSYMYTRLPEAAIAFTEKHLGEFDSDPYMSFLMNYYLVQLYGDIENNSKCLQLADKALELLKNAGIEEEYAKEYESQLLKYKERLTVTE